MTIAFDSEENIFLNNGHIVYIPVSRAYEIPENIKVFYEVIRVIEELPLFLDEHLERLQKSTSQSGIGLDIRSLTNGIITLLKRNPVKEKNLRISLFSELHEHGDYRYLAYFIESHYPPTEAYRNGVRADLIPLERKNPNVKIENPTLRLSADKAICMTQTHEALLVNSQGYITEGSRSNFFAIANSTIITPPAEDVLEGVTRRKVIQLITEKGIPFMERSIHTDELNSIEGAFLTGTSPRVLPISHIGTHAYEIPNLTRQLLQLYDQLAIEDLMHTKEKYY